MMTATRSGAWCALVLASLALPSCRKQAAPEKKTHDSAEDRVGYPQARWRLATRDELDRSVLWISHIVVMHEKSSTDLTVLRPGAWNPDTPPTRSVAEARARAIKVAALARETPGRFEELALTYSDDVVTRASGGSLAGVAASQLPAAYLDALAVLKPGESSRVVETQLGFHVVKRRQPPPDAVVSGKRLVIRYKDTIGPGPSQRSRSDALRLIQDIRRDAAASPARFDELVQRFSESFDKVQAGDIGVWTLREAGRFPREREQLAALALGQVSLPIDSIEGFQLLLRTPASTRPVYAMEAVQIHFNDQEPPTSASSKTNALRRAKQVAARLHEHPADFARLQQEHCCRGSEQWSKGRGLIGLDGALESLRIGQIARDPVESQQASAFVIPRRLDPGSLKPAPAVTFDLPRPNLPRFTEIMRHSESAPLAAHARLLAEAISKSSAFEPQHKKRIAQRFQQLASEFEKTTDPERRLETWEHALRELRVQLGNNVYTHFEEFLNEWASALIMQEPRL
jgi:hypothetical protein